MSCNPDFSNVELIEKINELKKSRNAVILAHNYVLGEIQEIADFCGDSLELSIKAANLHDADVIVFCGVRFMAESAKILSPGKTVLLPAPDAGCAMADMVKLKDIELLRQKYPDAEIVCYVNSTAEIKTVVDICCTSANAVKIIKSLPPEQPIIMIPDGNLAENTAKNTKRQIIAYKGYCPVHNRFTVNMITEKRMEFPMAKVFVHPECPPEVVAAADAALSTSGMLRYVQEETADTFIVGTEIGIIHRLKRENPGKKFIPLTEQAVCPDMKKCELYDVYVALRDLTEEIILPADVITEARKSIDRMLES